MLRPSAPIEIDPRVRLAYDESIRGLDMQSDSIDELRSRTGVLLAAASISLAFLGATALKHHHVLYWVSLLAIGLFVATIVLCLCVIWPSEIWEFTFNAWTLDEAYYAKDIEASQMCRSMTESNAKSWATNEAALKSRFTLFRCASVALGLELVAWLIDIGVN